MNQPEAKPKPLTEPRERLAALRTALAAQQLDGFILPLADEHLGEFIPDASKRLAWLTGFTGSAGSAIVLADKAALFIDGRYTLQAAQEIDAEAFEVRHFRKPPATEWLTQQIAVGTQIGGARIGYDSRITSMRAADLLVVALKEVGAEAVALDANPVDALWADRPALPVRPVELHPVEFSGQSADDKIEALAEDLKAKKVDAAVLGQLDSIAWLFNVRGTDVANTPVVQSFAILRADGSADFLVDRRKLTPEIAAGLGNRARIRDMSEFAEALAEVAGGQATVAIDPDRTNAWIRDRLVAGGATIKTMSDPTALPRARKNAVEIAGMRAAHVRDGRAMVRMLKWIGDTVAQRRLTELDVVAELERIRGHDPRHRGPSFDTIAGSGPNGAIVHYRPMPASNRALETGSLLLLDSGAQYLDGTTDITRTIAIGPPSAEMKLHYTLVLKAHIAIATARFPKGATGGQLDPLARQHLWREGLDYDHGTGHGVGAYLGVHEGPQRIAVGDATKLEPGMIISNEPGLYLTDRYGIRTENLVLVCESAEVEDFLEFETITLAPYDSALIDCDLLDAREIAWLNAYHAQVRDTLLPELSDENDAWLRDATAAI
jgi:Xaa-Pro aminopeptidase